MIRYWLIIEPLHMNFVNVICDECVIIPTRINIDVILTGPAGIRTRDPRFARAVLYRAELQAHVIIFYFEKI